MWRDASEKALAAAIVSLGAAARKLLDQKVYPYVPIPDPPNIEISLEVVWPRQDKSVGLEKRINMIVVDGIWYPAGTDIDNAMTLAQQMLHAWGYMPNKVASAIRKIEEAEQWCLDAVRYREREAQRILDEARASVEFIEARAITSHMKEREE